MDYVLCCFVEQGSNYTLALLTSEMSSYSIDIIPSLSECFLSLFYS